MSEWILIIIIVLMAPATLVGLDEMIQSWRLSRWYERRDRQHRLIKKLKSEAGAIKEENREKFYE